MRIPFNRPFVAGRELHYVARAVTLGNIGGDGFYTQACSRLLEERLGIPRVLLTPSCTAALEMAALLCDLQPGDEVILPSYTFVSTAAAVVRAGGRPVFVDIRPDTLNLDESLVEAALTDRTRALFVVHYAGVGCEMDRLQQIARAHNLLVIEDAAQAVNAFYRDRALGSIGHLGCYSFHETKNYICGEGGALCINDERLLARAEILRDKGTNRQRFFRGEVDKYTWVDVGSSYVPSELCSAFLYGQLELLDPISQRREQIYRRYQEGLAPLERAGQLRLPRIPEHCRSNYHLFYVLMNSPAERTGLLDFLKARGIHAVFHYVPLHSSPMGRRLGGDARELPVTDSISDRLVRLPMFHDITSEEQADVVAAVTEFVRHPPAGATLMG